ncbi:MAG: PQQ-dependent sugar dehydrogenase [Marmoricola sp.]|jgi:glucose/arabinose dehydrogenase|nr:PQQ-dependent sugar dehydrogenase [Marmoricola sp.]
MRRTLTAVLGLVVVSALVTAPGDAAGAAAGSGTRPATRQADGARAPALRVTVAARGLDTPWDVKPIGKGRFLVTERTSKRLLTMRKGVLRTVSYPSSTVWAGSETGLMSIAVDPRFKKNRRFYTCQGGTLSGGRHDVRVMIWKLGRKNRAATLVGPLLTGLPSTSGRHGGCRLLISGDAMIVGTGDAATGTNPRNLNSLGGKTLRLNRFTGAPWPKNRWIRSSSRNARYVLTFGHRNVQGLAQRADGTVWSVEHGPDRDDEVNVLVPGGDYGWNPVPGYNENVPMTDQSLPGTQIGARWRSGFPTLATSGAAWVKGRRWGQYDGMLAVAALKGERLMFMRFDAGGRFSYLLTPSALTKYGRLRSVTPVANGDLLVTTANGGRRDYVLRVHPLG